MKQFNLTNEDIGALCRSLAHLTHAGIGAADALALLAEDEQGKTGSLLTAMAAQADSGGSLAAVFRDAGCFPAYVCGLLTVGEQVGRTEETLQALAVYYEGRSRMHRRMKAALVYPAVLLAILLAVVVILLVWVLPVFNDVYLRLGSRLTGLAGGLLLLGGWLRKALPVLAVLLGMGICFGAVMGLCPDLRRGLTARFRRRTGGRGLQRQLHTAHFAQALSMGLHSGMTEQEAVTLAAGLTGDVPAFQKRCTDCLAAMDGGASLGAALRESGLLTPAESRLLEAGIRGGSGEAAMEQIAARLLEESEYAMERRTAKVEPAIVAVLSVMVGVILLSVMVPLMQIMTAIG